jgi:hypothetical protein
MSASIRHILSASALFALVVFANTPASAGKTDAKKKAPAAKVKKSGSPPTTQDSKKPTKSKTAIATKPASAPVASGSTSEDLDKICRRDLSWGKLDAVRQRCADLVPRNSPAATFWRLTLSDDPNDLRKGYAPSTLGKGEVDSRLLLSAGRYHFARGQIKELEDLVEIARKKKIGGLDIDTLTRLAAGK